ncbi:glycoside hydrolase family 29 protein [Amanita thiersii Skay4041]|uniref:alpha-L-fucosidase n=1 Tax=Amanita thiersii Skay4041 TaxID=703135 RepID=A0A2A9N8K2_9AGAR|nr:glycoside hydrolase family 29 protein [Amanita thiersii Skay4041]
MSFTPSAPPPSSSSSAALAVRRVRFTSRWEDVSNDTSGGELERAQVVEVTLVNLLPGRVQSRETSLTVVPGVLHRLVPADQAHVDVLVVGSSNADGSRNATVQVVRKDGGSSEVIAVSEGWETSPLLQEWPADPEVIRTHETPTWWNHAKFGIFVHWGVYSFPAWAPPSQYAEWYNWDLHNPPDASNPTWNHHIETFGKELIYDDFIANFTASKFNASEWIDLFDRAGAKYFVFVTKHHDGFALFDTGNTTHRSSVYFGPKRDFLAELMETAKKEKPDMHRGTYYSLPEWFNPDSARYGFGSWPGGLAHNAFNDTQIEPYTGRLEINDYVEDLQFPHMLDLAMKYETEIMWCDIGGPNKAVEFASQFYTNAMKTGRQVTMNNRCGAVPDFDTPEYATFGAIQPQSWESNEGMDPFSYGLNSATQAVQYKNGTTIVQTLVDIASKNGNFLLDVGPNAEGEIIPAMQQGLLDAGEWLSYSGECVYDTHYWFQSSQDRGAPTGSQPARFLTTPTTFCIVTFDKPQDNMLAIRQRLPILDGDEVALLLPGGEKRNVSWSVDKGTGHLAVQVEQADVDAVKYAWTVQVRYRD